MDEKQESSELPADKKKDAGRFNKKKCGMIAAVIVVIITLLVGINLGNSSAGRLGAAGTGAEISGRDEV